MDLKHLRVDPKHPRPHLPGEVAAWAASPAARWFQAQLEQEALSQGLLLHSAEGLPQLMRQQGVVLGLSRAVDMISELRNEEEDDE